MASQIDIGVELQRLLDTLPAPRGVKFDKAFAGYVAALVGFDAAHIHEAINRYFAGEYPELSAKYYPRAPELASIVRKVRAAHSAEADRVRRAEALAADRAAMAEADQLRKKTPEQLARATEIYRRFLAGLPSPQVGMTAKERSDIRARYGMTDEVLAGVRERPLPKGMKRIEPPSIPAPDDDCNLRDL
jgi:hypothetical protein